MQQRNIEIKCRFTNKEAATLEKLVRKSGLSREAYIRSLISGYVPTDLPPPEYHAMMATLRSVGTELNRIALEARVLGAPDAERYDEAVVALNVAVVEITNAVMLPRKIEMATRP